MLWRREEMQNCISKASTAGEGEGFPRAEKKEAAVREEEGRGGGGARGRMRRRRRLPWSATESRRAGLQEWPAGPGVGVGNRSRSNDVLEWRRNLCPPSLSGCAAEVGHGRLGHRGRAKAKAGAAGVVPIPIPRQAPSSSPHDDDDGVEELRQCRTWPHPSPRRPSLLAPQAQARGADTGQSSRPRHPCSPCGASTWRGAAETAAGGGARRWGGGLVSRCWRRVGLTEQRNRAEKCFCHSSVGGVAIPWKQ
jgi:hypothetical protein